MNFSDVATVLRKELRETLRDRRTLAVMVLFPLVVYPLVSLLLAQVIAGKQAAEEARTSKVALTAAAGLDVTERDLADVRGRLSPKAIAVEVVPGSTSTARADIAAGRIDALVEVGAAEPGTTRPIRLLYDETRDASDKAHARVESALAAALPDGCVRSYAIASNNIAPKSKVGGYVLSKILPMIVVIMTMLGAFYPAIDITAGERERGTLETLLASPVRRLDLMTGKVLAVAVLAATTGILNIASMSLTVAEGARLAGGGQALIIPWARAAATLATVVPAAFLFGAVMVAIGAMARGFKEAQTLLAPVYLLCFTPSLIASTADLRLSGFALFVPGMNLTLLARDLMLSQATWWASLVVLGSTFGYGLFALSFAARLYDSERLLAASDAEFIALSAWLRHLVGRDRGSIDRPHDRLPPGMSTPSSEPSAAHAILLFAVAFVLWFFVFTWLQRWRLIPGLLLSQWGGFLGLVWIYSRLAGRRLGDVLRIGRPSPWALGGAVLLGLSGWVILGVLADRLMPPPKELVEQMRRLIRPPDGDRPLLVSLLALAITPAICEEALFRGPILRGFRTRFSAAGACVLTGILFGILHGDMWRFIPTALLGALLSWVALLSGSILPAMIVHFVNNGALTILSYYRLDEATEKMPARQEIAMLVAAILMFAGGLLALRRGRVGAGSMSE